MSSRTPRAPGRPDRRLDRRHRPRRARAEPRPEPERLAGSRRSRPRCRCDTVRRRRRGRDRAAVAATGGLAATMYLVDQERACCTCSPPPCRRADVPEWRHLSVEILVASRRPLGPRTPRRAAAAQRGRGPDTRRARQLVGPDTSAEAWAFPIGPPRRNRRARSSWSSRWTPPRTAGRERSCSRSAGRSGRRWRGRARTTPSRRRGPPPASSPRRGAPRQLAGLRGDDRPGRGGRPCPEFADWCSVELLEPDGGCGRSPSPTRTREGGAGPQVAGGVPARPGGPLRHRRRDPHRRARADPDDPAGARSKLRAEHPELAETIELLQLRSLMVVPLDLARAAARRHVAS